MVRQDGQPPHQIEEIDARIVEETRRILLEWVGMDPALTPDEQQEPGWFLSLAEALIAQRIEDNQPVPMTAYDPIADELTELIDDEIRRNPPTDPDLPF